MDRKIVNTLFVTAVFLISVSTPMISRGQTPEFTIEIRNHLFEPSVLNVPANTKLRLIIYNRDPTPEEFESYQLNREKIIMGNTVSRIFIGPLPPGEYPFFGEFNPKTAQGIIVAQ